jgi:hypothetical protein
MVNKWPKVAQLLEPPEHMLQKECEVQAARQLDPLV